MDFTLTKYKSLLKTLQDNRYQFITFYDYLKHYQSVNQSISCYPELRCPEHSRRVEGQSTNQPNPATRNSQLPAPNSQLATPNSQLRTRNSQLATPSSELLIILRHDVDLKPQNSLATAKIEHELGIVGSYYFRMTPDSGTLITQIKRIFADLFKIKTAPSHPCENPSTAPSRHNENTSNASLRLCEKQYNPQIFNPKIIQQIAELGHEIGYHYETMDSEGTRLKVKGDKVKGDRKKDSDFNVLVDAAYEMFCKNLEAIKKIYPVKTICMHGSPRSRYDNREIWKKYDYRQLGIIGEPYFDIDFNEFFYLTDTGRRWDGHRVSVRDKMSQQEQWNRAGLRFRSTNDIIKAANENRLPSKIMITVHPQRWNDSFLPWAKELAFQNLKNIVKRIIIGVS